MKRLEEYIREDHKFLVKSLPNPTECILKNEYDAANFIPGDILDATFHYSAQFPYFYEVIANNGKTITVKKLKSKVVSGDSYGQEGSKVPVEGQYENTELIRCRIRKSGSIKINDVTAKIWDGNPVDFYGD